MKSKKWGIGVDIGGTKIAIGRVDETGHLDQLITVKTDVKGGAPAVINQIITAVNELQQDPQKKANTLGVGMAGQIDADSGNVHFAPNLYWHDVPLKKLLQDALKIPVSVVNDVRSSAWGEWKHGAGKGCNDIVCIFVGTGIGGGIISGGHLLIGNSNTAGELGHTTIELQGRKCTCGNHGCLEAIAGGWAIAERAREAITQNPKDGTMLLKHADGDIKNVTTKMVVESAHNGDPLANKLIEDTIEALIAGSVTFVNAFNPKKLIFGGGVINGLPEIVNKIAKGVKQRALKAACKDLEVVQAQLGSNTGVIGSASYGLEEIASRL